MTFTSPADVRERLAAVGYLPDDAFATTVYLAAALGKPLLVEGPAGVGKTELAKAVAEITGAGLVRLQCYEGLDEPRALYEWNYKKQLLRIQAAGDQDWNDTHQDIFSEGFLLERPLLAAIRRRARHAYWLNPEPAKDWDSGDSAASAYAEVVAMHECRNLTQLAEFVETLA